MKYIFNIQNYSQSRNLACISLGSLMKIEITKTLKDNKLEPIPIDESVIMNSYNILLNESIKLFNLDDNVFILYYIDI